VAGDGEALPDAAPLDPHPAVISVMPAATATAWHAANRAALLMSAPFGCGPEPELRYCRTLIALAITRPP
jgi:hypothetical protein